MDPLHTAIKTINESPFASGLSSALISGVILGIMFSLLVPSFLDWRKRPNVNFRWRGDKRGITTYLSRASDGQNEATLRLRIVNDGIATLKPTYWHLLIPQGLNPVLDMEYKDYPNIETLSAEDGTLYSSWHGIIEEPIFRKRSMRFPFVIKVKADSAVPGWTIFYWFSTEFGHSPKKASELEGAVEEMLPKLGKLFLKAPEDS